MNNILFFFSGLALGFFIFLEHYLFYAAIGVLVLLSGAVVLPVISVALFAIVYTGLEIDFLLLGLGIIACAVFLRRYIAFLR